MRRQERQEGIEEGAAKTMRAVALRMLRTGKYALEEIADASGLSHDEVLNLKAEAMA